MRDQNNQVTTQRSTRELVQDVIGDVQEIIRSEIRLAKTELKEDASKAGQAAGMFGGAAVMGLFGMALLEVMCVLLWAMIMPVWIACLVMAAISLVVAGILGFAGVGRWRTLHPAQKTVTSLREDLEWAKNQTR